MNQSSVPIILIVEDVPIHQVVIQEQIRSLGFETVLAPDGNIGLEQLDCHDIDLICSDCLMPNMDGWQMTLAIRNSNRPEKEIPIVAITSNTEQQDIKRCQAVGMSDYLPKPLKLDQLAKCLGFWIPEFDQKPCPSANTQNEQNSSYQPFNFRPTTSKIHINFERSEPVDLNALEQIIGIRDEDMFKELLMDFLAMKPSVKSILKNYNARESSSPEILSAIGATAHQLKSAAKVIGAIAFSDISYQLEHSGKGHRGNETLLLMPKFRYEWHRIEKFILSKYSQPPNQITV